jgi:tetratricopeptide (TPR) repeat protein
VRLFFSTTLRLALLLSLWLAAGQAALAVPDCLGFAGVLNLLEERLFADAADGRFSEHSLFSAAMIASGVEDVESLAGYQRRLDALLDELRQSGQLSGTPRGQIEAISEFMHRRVLWGGYDVQYTDLRMAFDHGRFNCISATVLMNCLTSSCGFSTRALARQGHARSRIFLSDGILDIENTSETWTLASCHKPAANCSMMREVTDVQLTAMIYYNRGVELLAQKDFAAAAAANAKALRLDPASEIARGNLLVTINNWAITLGTAGQFEAAEELFRQGMAMDPDFTLFGQNYDHLHRQWERYLSNGK